MSVTPIMVATGTEIAQYVQQHPGERFQLLHIAEPEPLEQNGPGSANWERMMQRINSMRGKSQSLSLEATSTEALYD